MLAAVERFLLTLWVGALWGIGYLAVPVLFSSLEDRVLAGMLAGRMFTMVSYIGLSCGALLLTASAWRGERPWRHLRPGLLVLMILSVVCGEFILQPMMAQLKAEGLVPGSVQAAEFGRLHGIASIFYLITSLSGFVLVLLGGREAPKLKGV